MSFFTRALLLGSLATASIANAQCPVDTILVKGRIASPVRDAKVRVQLLYANDQPGPSAETTPDNGTFRLPLEFLTQSTRPLLSNLKPKCDRKPKTVVVKLIAQDQEQARVTLDFPKDFKQSDPTAYTPQSEIVLKTPQ